MQPDAYHLRRLWLRRWIPVCALMVLAILGAVMIFGAGAPAERTPRALPWQVSLPLIFAVFATIGWLDWRSMLRHPDAPEKWFGNRGRRS